MHVSDRHVHTYCKDQAGLTEEDDVDAEGLELLPERIPRRSHSVVGIVDDNLSALLLEEVERLLFQTLLDG